MAEAKDAGVTVVQGGVADTSPKSIFHAITEIEQFSLAEQRDEISKDALTTFKRLTFAMIGMKHGAFGVLISVLITPIMLGVIDHYFPIFGTYQPSPVDIAFGILSSFGPSVAFTYLIAKMVSRVYWGDLTKSAINSFLWGYAGGKITAVLVFGIFLHFLYVKIPTARIIEFIQGYPAQIIGFFLSMNEGQVIALILNIHKNLISCAWIISIVLIINLFIIIFFMVRGKITSKRKEKLKEDWT